MRCISAVQISSENAVTYEILFRPLLISAGPNHIIYRKYISPLIQSGIDAIPLIKEEPSGKILIDAIKEMQELQPSHFQYKLEVLSKIFQIWSFLFGYIEEKGRNVQKPNLCRHEAEMKNMLSYIHDAYDEKITIEQLAKIANISKRETFRCFQMFTDKKPMEYINDYRLFCAVNLLKNSDKNLTEISQECGFTTSSYFGKKYGLSPKDYKQRCQKSP